MPKRIAPLTDYQIKSIRYTPEKTKLSDGAGLYLLLTPTGGKLWRYNYRYEGKQKTLAIGPYPEISLVVARERLAEARLMLAQGDDPCAVVKGDKAVVTPDTFRKVTEEWMEAFKINWTPLYIRFRTARMETHILPTLGKLPIEQVTTSDVLTVISKLKKIPTVAKKACNDISQVMQYAVATGKADRDVASGLQQSIPTSKTKHMAAPETPEAAQKVIRAIEAYNGSIGIKTALRLAPYLFQRPQELCRMEWAELDLDNALWSISADKMKMSLPHVVPLARQVVSLLRNLQALTGHTRYVFPANGKPESHMNTNTLNTSMRKAGLAADEICTHGFRAMARTLLDEVLGVRVDYIEHQLAHAVRDPNGRAYNRTAHLEGRREMMQQWADYLDQLKKMPTK